MTAIALSMLPNILTALLPIITGILAWVANSIAKRNAAAAAESKAATAALKLAAIGASLLQKGWNHIGPEIQQGFADGKWDPEDSAAVEASVKELLKDATDEATLKEIGDALGLPLAGVIAKVSSWLISKWTAAHDPGIPEVASAQFPVGVVSNSSLGEGIPDPTAG